MPDSYHEVVVEGAPLLIEGLVAGLLLAQGLEPSEILFAAEHDVRCESFWEQVAELIHLHANASHLLIPQPLYVSIMSGLRRAEKSLEVKIRADRPIRSASFQFSFDVYQREQAAELDRLIRRDPDRIRLSDDYLFETVDPSAAGVELYSPTHAYEVHAKGSATGSVGAVLSLHRACKEHRLMTVSPIELCRPDD